MPASTGLRREAATGHSGTNASNLGLATPAPASGRDDVSAAATQAQAVVNAAATGTIAPPPGLERKKRKQMTAAELRADLAREAELQVRRRMVEEARQAAYQEKMAHNAKVALEQRQ
jgi:hypothetical protein